MTPAAVKMKRLEAKRSSNLRGRCGNVNGDMMQCTTKNHTHEEHRSTYSERSCHEARISNVFSLNSIGTQLTQHESVCASTAVLISYSVATMYPYRRLLSAL
jgi:hypothetical protein